MISELESRDQALDSVLEKAGTDWRDSVESIVLSMQEQVVTGEDVRLACAERGASPHHHNAWGAAIGRLIRDGVLIPTGKYTAMKAAGSHGRKTQMYRIAR